MQMFRFKKGVSEVPYNRQGYIYFKSLLYKELPEEEKERIDQLCRQAGGEYWRALRVFVTTERANTVLDVMESLSEVLPNPVTNVAFVTRSHDTRFDGYGIIRPLFGED